MRKSELRYNSEIANHGRDLLTNSTPYIKTKNVRFAFFMCIANYFKIIIKNLVLTVEGSSYNDYPVWEINDKKDDKLNQFQMFFIRAIIGLFVAVIITRMFTGRIDIPYIVGLAIILVGLAYFSEYLRQRRNKP